MGCLSFLDFEWQSLDDLMKSKVQTHDNGFVCMICLTSIMHISSIKRHMRERHLSSDKEYYCPYCKKYFKTQQGIYHHIRNVHKDMKKINYDNLAKKA